MNEIRMTGLDASDPMGFMAAVGTLRVVSRAVTVARLHWDKDGAFTAVLGAPDQFDLVAVLVEDVERWRKSHPALDFAIGADRKVQDLKHPSEGFRTLMRELALSSDAAEFIAAFATGVAVDGRGQTKPTSFHLTAGQQRFLDVILSLRDDVTRADFEEALFGPWVGRTGPKDPRWRAASDRSRAMLSFDPGKEPTTTVAGAAWLAFQALPLFPVAPVGSVAVTTGFTGRGKNELLTWPVWSVPLTVSEVRTLLGLRQFEAMRSSERKARGIATVFCSDIVRSAQGYGNFSASRPV